MTERDQEDEQWEMSAFPCPACSQKMKLMGKERVEPGSSGHLLTFQCDCGQVFSTRDFQ